MVTKIQRWGNSLGLRIPKPLAEEISVKAGSAVDISVDAGRLMVRPVLPPEFRLRDLLSRVSPDNVHAEIATGEGRGRESW